MKTIFIVIDGFGLGAFPDALNRSVEIYGKIIKNAKLPTFSKLGVYNINSPRSKITPMASYGNLRAMSAGTDIITLYFELAGLHIKSVYPTYPKGLPKELIEELEKQIGINIIGNIVADGSRVINDLGALHYNTGYPILYTSQRSIVYLAAHEEITPVKKLYEMTAKIRKVMQGKNNVARIMASPFSGKINSFSFTDNNRVYTIQPPAATMLDVLNIRGVDVIAIGKIKDIFNGQGINRSIDYQTNEKSFNDICSIMKDEEDCFMFASIEAADLSRNDDIKVYTRCVEEIDRRVEEIMSLMKPDDLLVITSNHSFETADIQSKKYDYIIPIMVYGGRIMPGININTKDGLYCVAHTILDYYGIKNMNKSFLSEIIKKR